MKEQDIINRIRKEFPNNGIGDDTAVLAPLDGEILFACDAVSENVHFNKRYSTLAQIVQKLVTANVSDINAMGGKASALVLSAALPAGLSEADLDSIIEGLKISCSAYGIFLAGGDTVSSSAGMFFDAAIVGSVPRGEARMRRGAKEGDAIVLFGEIGPARAGLLLLKAFIDRSVCGGGDFPSPRVRDCEAIGSRLRAILPGFSLETGQDELRAMATGIAYVPHAADALRFIKHHLVPRCFPIRNPRCDGHTYINAMIDVSDGLGKDLQALCLESGVGARIDAEKLPIPGSIGSLFDLAGDELTDFALASGEEYVLLAAVEPQALNELPPGAAVIGRFVAKEEGITISSATGTRELPILGWEHSF